MEEKKTAEENKVNQFFYRLVAYGGISADPGIVYVWGDPNLLVPYEAFARLENGLLDALGDDGRNLLLWFGRISGYQASDVLGKRFGIPYNKIWDDDSTDIDNLINGATQDGFGFFKGKTYTPKGKPVNQQIGGKNCTIGKKYIELFGKQNEARDIYSEGVILGGIEFVYKVPIAIEETTCIAKGDKDCTFDFHHDAKADYFSKIFKKSKIDQKKTEAVMSSIYLKRPARGKFVTSKSLKFGDGNFIFHDQSGVVVATRAFSPTMEMAKNLIPEKNYTKLVDDFTKEYVPHAVKGMTVKGLPSTAQVTNVIKNLNLFGYGEFSLVNSRGKDIFIENKTNPLARDHIAIFGFKKAPYDHVICALLKNVFGSIYKTDMAVEEVECVAQGKRRCLFKLTRK
ncbi:MAG TPA: hypothetical protein VKE88_02415 [Candidatus Nanoarchaeia archaeon]|nr:hypothetical protein [Candidatus Nanoarchaeia archaeon]